MFNFFLITDPLFAAIFLSYLLLIDECTLAVWTNVQSNLAKRWLVVQFYIRISLSSDVGTCKISICLTSDPMHLPEKSIETKNSCDANFPISLQSN